MNQEAQQRIMGYFIEEARDHLTTIEQGLLSLKESMADTELINELFRAAHSIKGGSAMLGLTSIQRIAHRMEDFFNIFRSREGRIPVDQHLETLLLRGFDSLSMLLEELQSPQGLSEEMGNATLAELEPVFAETETHIYHLLGEVESAAVVSATPAPAPDPRQTLMTERVPQLLRQMLELYKQGDQSGVRDQLQEAGRQLFEVGVTLNLPAWQSLTQAVNEAIANPANDLRNLALVTLRDLKQAQQAVLQGQEQQIVISTDLLALSKPAPAAAPAMTEAQRRILGFFLEEAGEHLQTIEQGLLSLKTSVADAELINDLFRAAHSIKGGAAQLGLGALQKTAHRLEDSFSIFRSHPGEIPVDQHLETLLLQGYDALAQLLQRVQELGHLPEAEGEAIWTNVEPVFAEAETYIERLQRGDVVDMALQPEDGAQAELQVALSQEIPALLRQMLEQFRQPDPQVARSLLIQSIQRLQAMGQDFGVMPWVTLTQQVQELVAQLDLPLTDLALPVLRDLRQGHQLWQAGQPESIQASSELLALQAQLQEPELEISAMEAAVIAPEPEETADLAESTWEMTAEESTDLADDFGALFEEAMSPAEGSLASGGTAGEGPSGIDVADDFFLGTEEIAVGTGFSGEDSLFDSLEMGNEDSLWSNWLGEDDSSGLAAETSDEEGGSSGDFDPTPLQLGDDDELAFADLFTNAEELAAIEEDLDPSTTGFSFTEMEEPEEVDLSGRIDEAKAEGDLVSLFSEVTGIEQSSAAAPDHEPVAFEQAWEDALSTAPAEEEDALDLSALFGEEAAEGGSGFEFEESATEASAEAEAELSFEDLFTADTLADLGIEEEQESLAPSLMADSSVQEGEDLFGSGSADFLSDLHPGDEENGDDLDLGALFGEPLVEEAAVTPVETESDMADLDLGDLFGEDFPASEPTVVRDVPETGEDADAFDLEALFPDAGPESVPASSGVDQGMGSEALVTPPSSAQEEEALQAEFDKLDALFGEEDGPDLALLSPSSSRSAVDTDGDGQVDLDELSQFLELEPEETALSPEPAMETSESLLDLENELDALFQAESAVIPPSPEQDGPNLDDLAALFDEKAPAAPELSSRSPAPAPPSTFEAELDAILGDLSTPVAPLSPAPAVSSGPAAPSRPRTTVAPASTPAASSTRRTGNFSNQTMRVEVRHLDSINNLVGELVVNRNSMEQNHSRLRQFLDGLLGRVQQLAELGQRMQDQYDRSLLETALLPTRGDASERAVAVVPSSGEGNGHSSGQKFDALEMDRFTAFHALSQEMIELIVRVRESSSDIEFAVDEAEQIARQFRQITTQLQEGLNRARMVPFSQIADRLPRAIRDLSIKTSKQATLIVEGRETSIDKAILEELYDPMTHLVNNALVHGIESPDLRRQVGKSPEGKIMIKAFYQGNQTIIVVSDDGGGINVEKVKQKAIDLGLLTAEADQDEVFNILFHPGFSGRSAEEVDDLAGRGVGLDVVRRNISELRGSIQVDSSLGQGTTFTIRLPLTLSISKAMVCVSNKALIAFPLDGVEEMLDVPQDEIELDDKGRPSIPWRDQRLHYQPLSELLGYSRLHNRGRAEVYSITQDEGITPIVILQSAGQHVALQVDTFVEEQEIVIKQLRGPVSKPPGIAGATVLGNGRVLPIADIIELVDMAQGRTRRDFVYGGDDAVEVEQEHQTTVLIVDDSITVRELLSMTFNKVGYRVEQARDGQDAWEKLRGGLPCDIIFCDIEMPRMDGLELLSRLREDDHLQNLPIAMLTSRGAERHRQTARDLGATAYFTKPYLEEELLSAAARMLKGERLLSAS
jgi:chemosensory pili system protein ChpA (sensor histidine kinase/response regulator)